MVSKFFSRRPARISLGPGAMIAGRYRLDAEIGRGGMGIVYRAHDLTEDRDVAIKVVNLDQADARAREQFLHEARIMMALHHPHILAAYETGALDAGTGKPAPYIVMELVQGTSLRELRGLTFAQIVDLGRQICEALEYAHGQGLVHRDLKPENVLVERNGFRYSAKLADLGLAQPRSVTNLPMGSGVAGTVYYVAPEVIAGQPADVAADLYALGAVLYEMVTGRVPFSNYDEESILSQHLTEPVVPPSRSRGDIPPALESLILRLLAKDPKERYFSARQVGEALEQVVLKPAGAAPRGNLPQDNPVTFHGKDVERVKAILQSSHLVTLVGAAQPERKALALAVGAGLADEFADGVWLASLEGLAPGSVLEAVAALLGIRPEPGRALTVSTREYLRDKNLLLLLDGCDAVTGACAQFADMVLRACPAVRILVTSERALKVKEETIYPLSLGSTAPG